MLAGFEIKQTYRVVFPHTCLRRQVLKPVDFAAQNYVIGFRQIKIWRHVVCSGLNTNGFVIEGTRIFHHTLYHDPATSFRLFFLNRALKSSPLAGYFLPRFIKTLEKRLAETLFRLK